MSVQGWATFGVVQPRVDKQGWRNKAQMRDHYLDTARYLEQA